ncbi:MAG TPA: hypothetical protein DCM07_13630 [Planctomycetaceae bacterium]|nr:hypothetical protein [Gimesia sp.]HAH45865.1 hypothetical protein [Planctomycetaceae bacterium]HBL47156.1 hypothetical protein [Planctomycetaceae bacterium]
MIYFSTKTDTLKTDTLIGQQRRSIIKLASTIIKTFFRNVSPLYRSIATIAITEEPFLVKLESDSHSLFT